jgi:hypothetical protein
MRGCRSFQFSSKPPPRWKTEQKIGRTILSIPSAVGQGRIPGTYYSGTFGMEVWELGGRTSVPAGIDLNATMGSGVLAYEDRVAAGFKKEATYAGQTMDGGAFWLGNLTMGDVSPAGSSVVLGLAIWNTSAASWPTMLGSADANTRAGVLAFPSPTVDLLFSATLPWVGADINANGTALGEDLVMTTVSAIPEPLRIQRPGVNDQGVFEARLCRVGRGQEPGGDGALRVAGYFSLFAGSVSGKNAGHEVIRIDDRGIGWCRRRHPGG